MLDASVIDRARSVTIESVLAQRRLLACMRRHGAEYVGPCPRCGGTDRFSISIRKQTWNCRQCKPGAKVTGNVIGLVCWLDGVAFPEAVEILLGERIPATSKPAPAPKPSPQNHNDADAERLRRAAAIWRASIPIAGTPGEAWLVARGIDIAAVPEHGGLRFHPRCPWEHGDTPCVVARFTDARTNAPLGIHRRPIAFPGAKPWSLGPIAGGVIQLWPDVDVAEGLVLGEGVETTLAAATRIEHRGTLLQPAWACGSAGALAAFPVLAGIEALTILVDHDKPDQHGRHPGQDAAQRCAERWAAAGREVTLLTPDDLGADFNDLVRP